MGFGEEEVEDGLSGGEAVPAIGVGGALRALGLGAQPDPIGRQAGGALAGPDLEASRRPTSEAGAVNARSSAVARCST